MEGACGEETIPEFSELCCMCVYRIDGALLHKINLVRSALADAGWYAALTLT